MRFLERAIVMAALLLVAATGGSEGAERQHRPEKQTVTVKGTAVIDGGNVAAAEKAARADAMRKGIEQVIGAMSWQGEGGEWPAHRQPGHQKL